jgi:predicted AAA+ superfamily ATPase
MKTERGAGDLILFTSARDDAVVRQLASFGDAEEARREVQRLLLGEIDRGEITGNLLQNYLCRLLAQENNVFTRMAEAGRFDDLCPGANRDETTAGLDPSAKAVLHLAAGEISVLQRLYESKFDFGDLPAIEPVSKRQPSRREAIHQALQNPDPTATVLLLAQYHRRYGAGIFEASPAFVFAESGLAPVHRLDPITFDDLVGCDEQKRILTENTAALLRGLPANNVLLYGDSGTGKSSSVKALLNRYADRGLKLISIARDRLECLPEALDAISGSGMKFILYIDDLSFEENEGGYKVFKSVIEGSLLAKPSNAIFIVTSNRKNIVRETWSERAGGDDIRRRDTMQEKRSLADRFGITLVYAEPSQEEYLAIVKALAAKAGLDLPAAERDAEALKWEIRKGGRTGRTAKQFVDYRRSVKEL